MAKTKLITIPHVGPIYPKSGIFGPIETPYVEDISVIGTLLMKNYPVIEHREDGEQVELTLANFDNGAIKVVEHVEEAAPVEPAPAKEEEEVQPPAEEEKQEEPEVKAQAQANHQKNKKNKKNRPQADDLEAK